MTKTVNIPARKRKTEAEYMAEMISTKLYGLTIGRAVIAKDDEFGDEFFGFIASDDDGKELIVWVNRDAEGNGAGWLSIEPYRT